jgi:hypothetical protein
LRDSLVERIFLSLKQEEVWPQDYASFAETQAAVTHWILDYNTERPHQSLKYRTPAEVRRRRWDQRNPQPEMSTAGGVTTTVFVESDRGTRWLPRPKRTSFETPIGL